MLGDRLSFVLHQRAKAAQNPQTSHFPIRSGRFGNFADDLAVASASTAVVMI
jgi:hypothetical protein